jgi:ADP-ribosylglycohydrolase
MVVFNAQNRPLSNEAATACKADHPITKCTSGCIIIIIIIISPYRRTRLNQRVIITQNIGALPDHTTRRRRLL